MNNQENSPTSTLNENISKQCRVCGDKALGFNFNGLSCESCKAFFRRNAVRQKEWKCRKEGRCEITKLNRKKCKKCRLKKCFDIGMKKEWILSEDEKKTKRDKIVENRRKKDPSGNPYNLDGYSSSSEPYSPELKPSIKSLNSDLLNSNYSLSVSEGKGFFNSLYLLEQYQNQYQNFLTGKTPKEPMVPYSASIAKVPNHNAADLSVSKPDSALRSPPPMATTSPACASNSSMLDGYSSIYQKGLDYYGPLTNNHHRQSMQALPRPGVAPNVNGNFHLNGKPLESNLHQSSSHYFPKCQFDIKPEINNEPVLRQLDQASSNSSDSSYQFNSFFQEKNLVNRSRSESQLRCTDSALNSKSDSGKSNGSSGFRENGAIFLIDSNGYLSSDEENLPKRASYSADHEDLNEDSNSVCNSDVSFVCAKSDLEINTARMLPTVKPSLSLYNFIEELRVQELTIACDMLSHWCQYSKIVHEMLEIKEMASAVEVIIKKVIEMARMVTTFKELCEMEQIALLKGSVTEMIILRSVLNYVPEKESWMFNLDEEHDKGQFLKYSTYQKVACKSLFVDVKDFMLEFLQDWKSDRTLFDLLTVITLFTPNRPNLKHKEIIKLEYLTYRHLLQKHLESKYASKDSSRNCFTALMDLLEKLHKINDQVNKMYAFKVIESYKP